MARSFNGSTDRIDYPSAFDTTGQALTIAMWIKFGTRTGSSEYIFNSAASGGGPGTLFYIPGASGNVIQFFRNANTTILDKTTSTTFSNAFWYHLVVTHTGVMTSHADVHIYFSGTEASYASGTNGSSEITANSGYSLGGRTIDDIRNLNAQLAEFAIWNRVITAGERAALAKGYPPDDFPALLKFHDPLIRAAGNRRGGAATLDGTTVVTHPRIIRRVPRMARYHAGAAPTFKAAWAKNRNTVIVGGRPT